MNADAHKSALAALDYCLANRNREWNSTDVRLVTEARDDLASALTGELCANCSLTYAGHVSNTGCLHPCWKPSGRFKTASPVLRLAAPADDAGVREEAAAEALAKMIIRQEALTIKTPEAALHHMAHWRRAIEEGRDLLATLNRVAAEAAASTQEGG